MSFTISLAILIYPWDGLTCLVIEEIEHPSLRKEKVINCFVHEQTCNALLSSQEQFSFQPQYYFLLLFLLSYFLPLICGISSSCRGNVFLGQAQKNELTKCEAFKDAYSLLEQKFNVTPSFSNRIICCLMILLRKPQK